MPRLLMYLWDWTRSAMFGMQPSMAGGGLSWSDLAAWCALTGTTLEPWESRAMLAMSDAYANASRPQKTEGK